MLNGRGLEYTILRWDAWNYCRRSLVGEFGWKDGDMELNGGEYGQLNDREWQKMKADYRVHRKDRDVQKRKWRKNIKCRPCGNIITTYMHNPIRIRK